MNPQPSTPAFDAQNPLIRDMMFRALIEHSNDIVTVLAEDGAILFKGAAAEQALGYDPGELTGKIALDFIHPADNEAVRAYLERAFSSKPGSAESIEYRFSHKDGTWRYFEANVTPLDVPVDGARCVVVISRDISHRKAIERKLNSEIQLFENAFELSPIGIALVAPSGAWLRVNQVLCETLGYTQEELMGMDFQTITYPDDLDLDLQHVQEMLRGERKHYAMEKRYCHKDGAIVWALLNVSLVRNEEGAPEYFISQVQDITARKQSEERLRLLESVIVNANDAIVITEAEPIDEPGPRILYANAAFLESTGYSLEEVLGQTPRMLQGPKTQRDQLDKIRAALKSWQPIVVELLNYRKDGTEYWVELSIVPVANEKGWYTHWVSIQRDVSERRENEAALRESEARKTAIFDNALDAIITMDAAGNVVEWNHAAEEIFGYPEQAVKGKNFSSLIIPESYRQANRDAVARYFETGVERMHGQRLELPALRADGHQITIELIVTRLSTSGDPLFAGFMRDLSHQKKVEADLVNARNESERANSAKSEFLSRMSHELRTPLNAILGFSQILQSEAAATPFRDVVDDIHGAGKHLLLLINEVLDITRIEAGQLALSPEPVAIDEVASEAMALIAPLAIQGNITIQADAILDSTAYVLADRQRLVQCLLNLLANAVKYNRKNGRVTVECLAGPEYLQIAIHDTGIGIGSEKIPRLFTPFDRLGAEQRGIEGTGLGLALTRDLIHEMGGTLGVKSTPGVGSTFWFKLPIAELPVLQDPAYPAVQAISDKDLGENTILLIEDNPLNLRVVERALAHRPHVKLLPAMYGRIGLELALQHKPDLILLDLHLPDIQGEVILQQLQLHETTKSIPVVVLSADATPGQVERLKAGGALEYVTKPIDVPKFLDLIDSILSRAVRDIEI